MGIVLDGSEADTAKLVCLRDIDGRPALRIGLLATVFFEESWTRPVREAVADATEDYIQQFREHLRWTQQPKTGRLYPISGDRVPSPGEWLPKCSDGIEWEFGLHGGEDQSDVSDFQVSGLGSDELSKGIGFLQIHWPSILPAESFAKFPEFVLKICRRVKPLSGYGALGVLEPLSLMACAQNQPAIRSIADTFPGFEIEDRTGHTLWLNDGIKGVNWLTILSDRWVKAAGGLDDLRRRLDDDFTFHHYDGGLMIQAGPRPELGDAQANRWPEHYVTLARILKKIQIKDHYPMHLGGPGRRMDNDATMAWLFRFDGK